MGSTTSTSLWHIRLYSKYGLYDPLWNLQPLWALPVYGTNGTTVTMASMGHYPIYRFLQFTTILPHFSEFADEGAGNKLEYVM